MYNYYNPNPKGKMVEDCSIRAISKALNVDWQMAYALMISKGYDMCDMPSSNSVLGAVLADHGFSRTAVNDTFGEDYTVSDFCSDNPHGTYVLYLGSHPVAVVDGNLFDSWNSSNEVPQYYWYKADSN